MKTRIRIRMLILEENLFVCFFVSEYFMLSPLFEGGILFQAVSNIWHPQAGMQNILTPNDDCFRFNHINAHAILSFC